MIRLFTWSLQQVFKLFFYVSYQEGRALSVAFLSSIDLLPLLYIADQGNSCHI